MAKEKIMLNKDSIEPTPPVQWVLICILLIKVFEFQWTGILLCVLWCTLACMVFVGRMGRRKSVDIDVVITNLDVGISKKQDHYEEQ